LKKIPKAGIQIILLKELSLNPDVQINFVLLTYCYRSIAKQTLVLHIVSN